MAPLFLSVIGWRSEVPIEGEQEGESRPFRGRKGHVFCACEPRKVPLGGIEAKKQRSHLLKYLCSIKSNTYKDIPIKTQETRLFTNWRAFGGAKTRSDSFAIFFGLK